MNSFAAFKPLTKDDVAEVLGVSLRTIENWVSDGTLPAPKKLGNRVYWHPAAFYGWLDHRLLANDGAEAPVESAAPTRPQAPKAGPQGKATKSELDALRSRERAKLDAMLSS